MAEVNKKPNIFVRMGTGLSRWFREMKSELKKVVWPSGKQLVNNTVVVLVAVLIVGIIVCLFDLGAGELIGLLRKLFEVRTSGMAETAKWYVVHTYSGYENTVMATIEKTVETRQLQDIIQQVSIPMETVTEVTEKGPKTYDRKVFPGYVLVKMVMTDDAWYIIKNVRGVTGFVTSGSTKPTPLTEDEVIQLGVEKREIVVGYKVGDTVRIMDGPLTSFSGIVEELDVEKNRVRVTVSMFGRETPVDLELDQVELSTD